MTAGQVRAGPVRNGLSSAPGSSSTAPASLHGTHLSAQPGAQPGPVALSPRLSQTRTLQTTNPDLPTTARHASQCGLAPSPSTLHPPSVLCCAPPSTLPLCCCRACLFSSSRPVLAASTQIGPHVRRPRKASLAGQTPPRPVPRSPARLSPLSPPPACFSRLQRILHCSIAVHFLSASTSLPHHYTPQTRHWVCPTSLAPRPRPRPRPLPNPPEPVPSRCAGSRPPVAYLFWSTLRASVELASQPPPPLHIRLPPPPPQPPRKACCCYSSAHPPAPACTLALLSTSVCCLLGPIAPAILTQPRPASTVKVVVPRPSTTASIDTLALGPQLTNRRPSTTLRPVTTHQPAIPPNSILTTSRSRCSPSLLSPLRLSRALLAVDCVNPFHCVY